MSVLQVVVLLLAAGCATAVVAARDPLRQAMVASIYGLVLGILFFVFRHPTWRCRRPSWARSPFR